MGGMSTENDEKIIKAGNRVLGLEGFFHRPAGDDDGFYVDEVFERLAELALCPFVQDERPVALVIGFEP